MKFKEGDLVVPIRGLTDKDLEIWWDEPQKFITSRFFVNNGYLVVKKESYNSTPNEPSYFIGTMVQSSVGITVKESALVSFNMEQVKAEV